MKNDPTTKGITWHCLSHESSDKCTRECSLRRALVLFSKKYSLLILRSLLLYGKRRFNEILEEIECSPKTLSARLKDLHKVYKDTELASAIKDAQAIIKSR